MTLKKAMLRGLLGAPIGIFIGYTITILISMVTMSSGSYHPVVPQLEQLMGNELKAVMLQYVLTACMGFAYAFGSAIFEVEEWSITKQTVLHFLITATTTFPIAYICYWMAHSIEGILLYVLIFVVLYIVIWLAQYRFWKKKIEHINRGLMKR